MISFWATLPKLITDLEHGFFVNTQLHPDKKPDVFSENVGEKTLAQMDANSPEANDLINTLVSHHVAITSTLPVFEAESGPGRPPARQKIIEAMTAEAREDYFLARSRPPAAKPPEIDPALLWKHDLALEQAFAAAADSCSQVPGPDPTGRGDVLRGFGDQRGLELLVEARFSPLEAIKIATLNGAVYLGTNRSARLPSERTPT